MHDIQVRRARREELAAYERAPEQVTVTDSHFEESGFGTKPVWWAFVATVPEADAPHGECILGFALYYIRYSTWKGPTMYLEDLLVTEKARGMGIGFRLFKQLEAEARENRFNRISWQVLEWNEPAIRFYKKLNAHFDPEWINCSLEIKL
jgi:GNAT superfamily N-acetyltransferase